MYSLFLLLNAPWHLLTLIVVYCLGPNGPPRHVALIATDPAMLLVRYRSPDRLLRNGVVTGYVIRYTRVGSGVIQMMNVSSNDIGFRINDLLEIAVYTSYSVEVAAININGTGQFSVAVIGFSGQDSE